MQTKSNLPQFTPKRTRLFQYEPHLNEGMIRQLEEENRRLKNKLTSLESIAYVGTPDAIMSILTQEGR